MKTQFKPGVRNTKREKQIIRLHNSGLTQTEICERLGVKGGTVSYYLGKTGNTKHQKRSKASVKGETRNGNRTGNETEDLQVHIAYTFGKIETFIEHYADSAGLSRSAFAHGVATLLLRKTGGKVLGSKDRMSIL